MVIRSNETADSEIRRIQNLNDLFRQWPFFQSRQILLQLFRRHTTDNDSITTILVQHTVVTQPTHGTLNFSKIVFLGHLANHVKSIEVGSIPVAESVMLAVEAFRIKTRTRLVLGEWEIAGVSGSEETASKGLTSVQSQSIRTQAWDQFWLYCAREDVIETLVDDGLDPSISIADLADLCNFPRHVVGNSQPAKISLLMQCVHLPQSVFQGCLSIRA